MILEGKVVFITGGAQGFGKGVAEAVLKKQAKVCIADIKAEQGEGTLKALQSTYGKENVMFVKVDVTNRANFEDGFKKAISQFGQVDVMCNNAGILDENIWEKQIQINFNAVVYGTDLALQHMRTDKGGKGGLIINTASMAGLVPAYWFPVYSGTKSAVYNFTHSWAQNPEIKAAGVRFSTICPTGAQTALLNLDEHQIIQLTEFKTTMEKNEYCTVDQVVEGFLKVMEDDTISGGGVSITKQQGPVHVVSVIKPVADLQSTSNQQ